MRMESISVIADLAETFALEGDADALAQAVKRVGEAGPLDIAALLEALDRIKGEPHLKTRAILAIRTALGLPVSPGPVCRPQPLR